MEHQIREGLISSYLSTFEVFQEYCIKHQLTNDEILEVLIQEELINVEAL